MLHQSADPVVIKDFPFATPVVIIAGVLRAYHVDDTYFMVLHTQGESLHPAYAAAMTEYARSLGLFPSERESGYIGYTGPGVV